MTKASNQIKQKQLADLSSSQSKWTPHKCSQRNSLSFQQE